MTDAQMELARRLVDGARQGPGWQWCAGMLTDSGVRVTENEWIVYSAVPDLSDYATAAILLRMAMEADEDLLISRVRNFTLYDQDGLPPLAWALLGNDMEARTEPSDDLGTVAATALLNAWGEP